MLRPRTIYVNPQIVETIQETVTKPTVFATSRSVEILTDNGNRILVHNTPIDEVMSTVVYAEEQNQRFAKIVEHDPPEESP